MREPAGEPEKDHPAGPNRRQDTDLSYSGDKVQTVKLAPEHPERKRRLLWGYEEALPGDPVSRREGFVYFLQPPDGGLIKIGCTTYPKVRITEIRNCSPVPLVVRCLLRVVGDHYAVESEFHQRFAYLRQHGEWFRPAPELASVIGAVVEPEPAPRQVARPDGLDRLAAAIAAL